MQNLVYLLFLSILFLDSFQRYGLIPRQVTWLPDLLSVVTFITVVLLLTIRRALNMSAWHLIILFMLLVHVLFGVILNSVPTGAVFQGVRSFLKYIPFFLLPTLYTFTDDQIRKQIRLLIIISIFQFPLTLFQRIIESGSSASGDLVRGTLDVSSMLSIYLISVFSVCLAFYMKKRISPWHMLLLCILLLFPTTINETKGTLFLLPVGLIIPALVFGSVSEKIKRTLTFILVGTVFLAVFIPVYDHFRSTRASGPEGIIDFFTKEGRVEGYLAPQSSGLRTHIGPGRIDILINPFIELSNDPAKLAFGLGIGNISESFLGSRFSGEYFDQYGDQKYTAMANLLWEIGLLGTVLILMLWLFIYKDSKKVMKDDGIAGAIALGWTGVMGVLFMSLFYKNIIQSNAVSYLFWFYSGYIVAKSREIEWKKRQRLRKDRIGNSVI